MHKRIRTMEFLGDIGIYLHHNAEEGVRPSSFFLTHGLIQVANSKIFTKLGNGQTRELMINSGTESASIAKYTIASESLNYRNYSSPTLDLASLVKETEYSFLRLYLWIQNVQVNNDTDYQGKIYLSVFGGTRENPVSVGDLAQSNATSRIVSGTIHYTFYAFAYPTGEWTTYSGSGLYDNYGNVFSGWPDSSGRELFSFDYGRYGRPGYSAGNITSGTFGYTLYGYIIS